MAMNRQRGNTLVGIVIGLVLGLGAALAVAVYVTKVPLPFMNRSQTRTPEQDAAELRKNQNWDPNAPLYGKNPAKPQVPASGPEGAASAPASAPAAAAAPAPAPAPAPAFGPAAGGATPAAATKPSADPLGDLAAQRAKGATVASNAPADPFQYYVQAGAFRTAEDAEAQRAKLSLMGLEARVTEREQSGRQVFRVRLGPFDKREEAERGKARLESGGFEAALVRVQR